jgi:hypothetical protein
MKLFLIFLILAFTNCSRSIYKNQDWMFQIDLSGTEFTIDNKVGRDSILNSDFLTLKLPQTHCSLENIDFQPEFRIYNKYLTFDTLNYGQISDTLYLSLQNRFEILSSMMCPDEFGQLFGFVVQGKKSKYSCDYHLIKIENRYYLVETISTFGTKRKLDNDLKQLIKRIEPLKN